MADTQESGGAAEGERVVIKKYANRRLYNTASSSYVTLEHLADMVKKGVDFVVYDAKTNEDITRTVLTQIIFEEESQGQSLLPIQFLRQLIGFYGNSMQAFLPSYLELSLASFTQQQERMRSQFAALGQTPGAGMGGAFDEQREEAELNGVGHRGDGERHRLALLRHGQRGVRQEAQEPSRSRHGVLFAVRS